MSGALGGSVIFPLNSVESQIENIFWYFNGSSVITIESQEPEDKVIVNPRHKTRVSLLDRSYYLKLDNLRKNDSGSYSVEIHHPGQKVSTQKYTLQVYAHLSKPKISQEKQSSENGTCITNLTCSIEQEDKNVTYSWVFVGQETNEFHNGSVLPMPSELVKQNMTFKCVARNPVSNSSSDPITARELCGGAVGELPYYVYLLAGIIAVTLVLPM
ncbi:PREDICTED: SLAM family member 7 [Condylura cristata]|uniref:SLAM family member 7 n=1 Tax=Condylura cristata TaxID=143302 RepID=UPI000643B41E|nr:PREDICTED: SLAM family member 7 [Condylura cristata]